MSTPNSKPLIKFLREVCGPLINGTGEGVTEAFELALESYGDVCVRFCGPDAACLFVERMGSGEVVIGNEMSKAGAPVAALAVIKTSLPGTAGDDNLDWTIPLLSQVQVVTLSPGAGSGLAVLQQYTKHIYVPLVRRAALLEQTASSSDGSSSSSLAAGGGGLGAGLGPEQGQGSHNATELAMLTQKIRELELALEQCQRGASVPRVVLSSPPTLEQAAKRTTAAVLKGHLDKFNVSQVDQMFSELNLGVSMGDSAESKEAFANEINKTGKLWPSEISRLTRLIDSSPFSGSVESEAYFWKDMEARLLETKEQLEGSPTLLLAKIVLRRTNRVSEQLVREAEVDLDRCLEIVQVSVAFLRDLPVEEVRSATDLHPKLSRAVTNTLMHFSKLKHSRYDFQRAVRLLETLGAAVYQKILVLLRERAVLQSSMEDLRKTRKQADEVFSAWDSQFAAVRQILKDVAKRRNEKYAPVTAHAGAEQMTLLAKRFLQVIEFREQHERLLSVFSNVLHGQENDLVADLNDAWQGVLSQTAGDGVGVDILDVSSNAGGGGTALYTQARALYEKRLEKAEERITRLLEDRLSSADSTDEMFRIFSTFNALFFRPAIRNAVNSFRTTLVRNVREDVKRLQIKFTQRYDDSLEKVTANTRDIPPLSGRILWARQIENQLSTLMKRMSDVLGAGWEDHVDGKQLREVCDELRNYLNTDSLYNEWLTSQLRSDASLAKYAKTKDFLLLVDEDPRSLRRSLRVNFDEKQVVVFKEVRFLEWLLPTMSTAHKTIPLTIRAASKEAYQRYPTAMALQAALSSYAQARRAITHADTALLLANHIQAVRDLIKEAFGGGGGIGGGAGGAGGVAKGRPKRWIKWDSENLDEWSSQLSAKVSSLQDKVDDVNSKIRQVDEALEFLKKSESGYSTGASSASGNSEAGADPKAILSSLQSIVDDMQLRGFSNMNIWVQRLDSRVEALVSERLQSSISAWVAAFEGKGRLGQGHDDTAGGGKNGSGSAPVVVLDQTVHEIQLSNQTLFLSPPLEQARLEWISAFHAFVSSITSLPRLTSTRYQVFAQDRDQGKKDYSNVLHSSLAVHQVLHRAFVTIENKIAAARAHVQQWLQYQALWDASLSDVADRLGNDVGKWQQLLTEIRRARVTIDCSDDEHVFGPIVVNHRQVQKRVNDKYDSWQKDAQAKFGALLTDTARAVHTELLASKSRLEAVHLEAAFRDVILGVEQVLKVRAGLEEKKRVVGELEAAEKLLRSQRYTFPSNWLPVSNVSSALVDLCRILERRQVAMDAQLPSLQQSIREEDTALAARCEEFLSAWDKQRPVEGSRVPQEALDLLEASNSQALKLVEELDRVKGAKEALGLGLGSGGAIASGENGAGLHSYRLSNVQTEIVGLKDAWRAVAPAWDGLQGLRSTHLRAMVPAKLRKALEDLQAELRSLPAAVRGYECVEALQDRLAKLSSVQTIVRDLGTEALKERHWKLLLHGMGIVGTGSGTGSINIVQGLTVGMLWDANLSAHKKLIADTLSTAQGEQALEQFLRDLREQWLGCELNMVLRDGVRIIVGWDVLFSTLEDNLNSLASLKQSPYFRNVPEFQEDTANWETRLTALRGVFDVWIEVQRKWVYLRGIFRNPDIKAQLPAQFAKFKTVDGEFLALMKKVAQKPAVMELLQVENLLRQLDRQDATMTLIQKALGDYLEKQRQLFPRFYFVNNDDLVEIIGNSNEPAKIVAHLGKMFAALAAVEMTNAAGGSDGDGPVMAVAMCSKEGEVVPLTTPVNMGGGSGAEQQQTTAKDWLNQLVLQMAASLSSSLSQAFPAIPPPPSPESKGAAAAAPLLAWIDKFPAQIVILSSQMAWSQQCEQALAGGSQEGPSAVVQGTESQLRLLSESVLAPSMSLSLRRKTEQLLTEMVHQRDVARQLVTHQVTKKTAFEWLYHLRFYLVPPSTSATNTLAAEVCIKMSNASFHYGFEYLGVGERLVQTPLTDRCYLTLTQALHFRMGANPFGPAGTGKTESVKMLGSQLGRFVLVFNCDSSFDYAAMGRIFAGLCHVGAWGCFDEFNRLEERILSAVSQQILTIQRGLMLHQEHIELLGNGHSTKLCKDVGIFVTLNPGYAGRSNLPDNLKQLFRAVAMVVPDRRLIAQVMLFSQGIVTAEALAGKIVLLFQMCEERLSAQRHYDFGLRALKSVLSGAGDLKRSAVLTSSSSVSASGASGDELSEIEKRVLIKSACDSILPKLVAEDTLLFTSLLQAVFVGCDLPTAHDDALVAALSAVCAEEGLACDDGSTSSGPGSSIGDIRDGGVSSSSGSGSGKWVEKVLQLKQVLDMRHGVMLVGPSCSGKSTAWRMLLRALAKVDGVSKHEFHVVDPKSISKDKLYGKLDPNTLEWTDGVFTKVLRRVIEAGAGGGTGGARRCWIVFDGDVDPEWAENLNSVLDDNRILTLPTGDRLRIPDNVRIIMEVDSLRHATMATVSRCGMVWFADDVLTVEVVLRQQLQRLRIEALPALDSNSISSSGNVGAAGLAATEATTSEVRSLFVDAIAHQFTRQGLVGVALDLSLEKQSSHVMEASLGRLLVTLNSLLLRGVALAVDRCEQWSGMAAMSASAPLIDTFAGKWLLHSLLWAFGGSMFADRRSALGDLLQQHSPAAGDLPANTKLIDVQVTLGSDCVTSWTEWAAIVPRSEMEAHKVVSSDVVITTSDTLRHVEVLRAWLASHKPLLLCGPPGSGKTMTLTSVLEGSNDYILAALNFSSNTTPDLIIKTFSQYCEVVDSPDGLVMQPSRQTYRDTQWLVVFCDEINLPQLDRYGTQRVIMFMRQLTEQGGFWNNDCKWVTLRQIQFVGACNPPTDAGRVILSQRFLRFVPLLYVDYPAEASLKQIYRCFNHALLKLHPNLRGAVDGLTDAMVEFYSQNQAKFTPDVAPQYIYSPRELSRWVRAMYEAMEPLEAMTMDELVRLWAHEALRLFQDRLVSEAEKEWCDSLLGDVAKRFFSHGVSNLASCLQKPMLYSNWIKKVYGSTPREQLKEFVAARLKVFYEEELDVPLVIFDDVLDHVLRIDNVLRHPMGHLLLVGESGVGKTVLSRFVSWMNGLSVFQIKANPRYTVEQFDDDLRGLLRRVGLEGEKVCFIFDESNVLSSAFLERMNALLASGDVPGLFEGDDRVQLLSACRDAYGKEEKGLLAMTASGAGEDEVWRRFTRNIQRNLHVVFTMNPASGDFHNRCTASPALFNRCVVDWFGTWSVTALLQVAFEFTASQLDTGYVVYSSPPLHQQPELLQMANLVLGQGGASNALTAVAAALVSLHTTVKESISRSRCRHYLSPRDFLDLISKFSKTEQQKRGSLEDQQAHIRTGLLKLLETQEQVAALRQEVLAKEAVLRGKDIEANQKLQQMVEKQNEAEQRKALAEQLTVELEKQNEEIRVRRESVEGELSEAEPALLSAKQSVQNIRKQQLDELRQLARPPKPVQLTMEVVCIMIGEKNLEWSEIRKVVRREDFIPTIVNFDPNTLSPKQVQQVQTEYLQSEAQDSQFDYASVDRASKACGPLYQWAESQIRYATIIRKIKPLRDQVAQLTEQGQEMQARQKETVEQVAALEAAIAQYKLEYASAIRDTETIRSEMSNVSRKVARAESLLRSLDQEKSRWHAASEQFDRQMATLIGDCLLSAAFLTYAGIFDHRARKSLQSTWTESLAALSIPHQPELDVLHYLSSPSDHIAWKAHGLPDDGLAVENSLLLEHYNRYPLIIDPSGQAVQYLLNKFSALKIAMTSFLDASFLKTLASAIRFGTPLIVENVEAVDPVLNPILNRELQRAGGRTLIRLGTEDIDFSPRFFIVLSSRNPLAQFAPDVCSRVTLINFTVTPASLESQALAAILRAERPDVETRRTQLLRLQSEQAVRLRELEELLLSKISAVQGAILDDDSVVRALEVIKTEAEEINKEAGKTQEVMAAVRSASDAYVPLAQAMASVYFSLERLSELSFLYQFSLAFFLDVVAKVLQSGGSSAGAGADAGQRLQTLTHSFFLHVARRVLRGLRMGDKLVFAVRLAQICTQAQAQGRTQSQAAWAWAPLSDAEADFLLRGAAATATPGASAAGSSGGSSALGKLRSTTIGKTLTESVAMHALSLSFLPSFTGLLAALDSSSGSEHDQWKTFLEPSTPEPEAVAPLTWLSASSGQMPPTRAALLTALLVSVFRPERILPALGLFITAVFGPDFHWRALGALDLSEVLLDTVGRPTVPLLLCSEAGQDASSKVDALHAAARARTGGSGSGQGQGGQGLLQVSMGSHEGYAEAEKSITLAAKTGSWVLLRNVHLCPDWLGQLEKRLSAPGFSSACHESFRLFMTSEIAPALPSALVRASDVIVFETSTGVKANLQRFLNSVTPARAERQPAERARMYGLLGWLHAVVQERLRYLPLGWTKKYEFTETDAAVALDVIDEWVDGAASSGAGTGAGAGAGAGALRAHINPSDLPWKAIRTLLSQSIYGGRVDVAADQGALDAFIDTVFTAASYDSGFAVVKDAVSGRTILSLPDGLSRNAFDSWVSALPDATTPAWLGLSLTAEAAREAEAGKQALLKLAVLQGEENVSGTGTGTGTGAGDGIGEGGSRSGDAHTGASSASSTAFGARQRGLLASADRCLALLANVPALAFADPSASPSASAATSSISRALSRELSQATSTLALVRSDLEALQQYGRGNAKATNATIDMATALQRGRPPTHWSSLFVAAGGTGQGQAGAGLTVEAWAAEFAQRLSALTALAPLVATAGVSGASALLKARYWIGGLFSPESFVTATRQHAAQAMKWSLEDLDLHLDIGQTAPDSEACVLVEGLVLEGGAQWAASPSTGTGTGGGVGGVLSLSEVLQCPLPPSRLRWVPRGSTPAPAPASASRLLKLPMYLTEARAVLVADVWVNLSPTVSVSSSSSGSAWVWAQRGVCIVLNKGA